MSHPRHLLCYGFRMMKTFEVIQFDDFPKGCTDL